MLVIITRLAAAVFLAMLSCQQPIWSAPLDRGQETLALLENGSPVL